MSKQYITRRLVMQYNPCSIQLRLFMRAFPKSRYPDGAPVTFAMAHKHRHKFQWTWAASNLLAGYPAYDWFNSRAHQLWCRTRKPMRSSAANARAFVEAARRFGLIQE